MTYSSLDMHNHSLRLSILYRHLTPPNSYLSFDCVLCSYRLTFTPPGSGSFSGSLELLLPASGEKLCFSLVGKASEPLAEGHVLVECQVMLTHTFQFTATATDI